MRLYFDYDVSMRFCAPVFFIVSLVVSGCSVSTQQSIPDCVYETPEPLLREQRHERLVRERLVREQRREQSLMEQLLREQLLREQSPGWIPDTITNFGSFDSTGMKQGLWTMWHENGQKMMEAGLEIGMAEGIFRMWYDNGQIREEGIYKNSEKNGICRGWHEDGTINAELSGIYKDGKKISDQE